jgi:PleD family two-component response regulator
MRGQLEAMELAIQCRHGKVTAAFGIAELGPGEDADKLAERADEQLEAKRAGRNRVATGQAA